jgi:uncharacterized protein
VKSRYNSINDLLKQRFGERVFKVTLESGCACPNRDGPLGSGGCTFCQPEALRPSTAREPGRSPAPIAAQLAEGIDYIRRRHGAQKVIAYFQNGTNTAAPAAELVPLFHTAIGHPAVVGLAISTRPDCIEEGHLELLQGLAAQTMLWVELGLQSAHDATLVDIRRGHTAAQFALATERLARAGIPVCAHVILGLPGETPEMMRATARFLNDAGVWGVKIHNLHVLAGTAMAERYERGELAIPSLAEYAGWVVDFLEELAPSIVIHRVNGHSPRRLTVAPAWSVNKLAILNAVEAELERRQTWQGKYCREAYLVKRISQSKNC